MLKLIKAPAYGNYIQSHQSNVIKFSFANKEGDTITEIFAGVRCRDYLGDVLYSEENNEAMKVFGFKYDPAHQKIDRDKVRFVLQSTPDLLDNIEKNIGIINDIETQHGLELSTVTRMAKDHILLEGDPKWMKTIYLISYYSFLVKVCSYVYNDYKQWQNELQPECTEGRYLDGHLKKFNKLTNNLFKICEPYTTALGHDSTDSDSIHCLSGFLNLINGHSFTINNVYHQRFHAIKE